MNQHQILGRDLYASFPLLHHESKRKLAEDLGTTFRQMLAMRSEVAGLLTLSPSESGIEAEFQITPWFSSYSSRISTYNDSSPTQSVRDSLVAVFRSRREDHLARYQADDVRTTFLREFIGMTVQLDKDDWFAENEISLCHLDLAPRNILIASSLTDGSPLIVGILDWDSAVFAPSFLLCTPPLWLWAWQADEDEDERTADDIPATTEDRELKKIFEDAAGPKYLRFAYCSAYRLARRLVRFAIDGIRSSEDIHEAMGMQQEWSEWRRSYKSANNNDQGPWGARPDLETSEIRAVDGHNHRYS